MNPNVLEGYDIGLEDAIKALEDYLNNWWDDRKKKGTVHSGGYELHCAKEEFFQYNPEYKAHKEDMVPYFVTVPGSFRERSFCSNGCCDPPWSHLRATVQRIAVRRPDDWTYIRSLVDYPTPCKSVRREKMTKPTPSMEEIRLGWEKERGIKAKSKAETLAVAARMEQRSKELSQKSK